MRRLGNCGRTGRIVAALWVIGAAPAGALQVLEAADHAELAAEVSSGAVNRIALEGDRIARVVQSSGGFTVEHDPVRGDLYLYPNEARAAGWAGTGEAARDSMADSASARAPGAPAPVTLYLGTELGFTYRLSLTPVARESAQILIRNPAATATATGDGSTIRSGEREGYEQGLAELVRAVARRRPPSGYVVVPAPEAQRWPAGVRAVEIWRGPRFTARVLRVGSGAPVNAKELAAMFGPDVAAAWLGPADGNRAERDAADGNAADGHRAAGGGETVAQHGALAGERHLGAGTRLAVVVQDTRAAESVR